MTTTTVFQLNENLHTDGDWKDNNTENNKSEGTDDAGCGNATNAEEHNSQNQSGILFPVAEEISRTETDLIAMIKTTGKNKDYELIEYILNVNTQYTQILMELNENGAMDAVYTYGASRLTEDRFTGESNFYLYDPAGNVAGITDQNGYLWQSYRYDAFGNATFGSPQYDNEYAFNTESYNPNIRSQYLRSRYYDTVKGNFLTEDSYLGDIREPLTLNRYGYCIGNPLFYDDPSGHYVEPTGAASLFYNEEVLKITDNKAKNVFQGHQNRVEGVKDDIYNWLGESSELYNEAPADQALNGFVSAYGASFYATYDKITHLEYYNYENGNYRAIGEDAGYVAGNLTQAALARAAVKKSGDLLDNKTGKTRRPFSTTNRKSIDIDNPFYKQGGGADVNEFMNPHAQKHMYNPDVKSTRNKTQFGENIDVAKLREDTLLRPDKVIYDSRHNMIKYIKESDFNISTSDTPTGSHRIFINLDPKAGKTIRNSQFPYYGGTK